MGAVTSAWAKGTTPVRSVCALKRRWAGRRQIRASMHVHEGPKQQRGGLSRVKLAPHQRIVVKINLGAQNARIEAPNFDSIMRIINGSRAIGSRCVRGPLVVVVCGPPSPSLRTFTAPSPESHLRDRDHNDHGVPPSYGAIRGGPMPIPCSRLGAGCCLEAVPVASWQRVGVAAVLLLRHLSSVSDTMHGSTRNPPSGQSPDRAHCPPATKPPEKPAPVIATQHTSRDRSSGQSELRPDAPVSYPPRWCCRTTNSDTIYAPSGQASTQFMPSYVDTSCSVFALQAAT